MRSHLEYSLKCCDRIPKQEASRMKAIAPKVQGETLRSQAVPVAIITIL
jgi:hypothetical protein